MAKEFWHRPDRIKRCVRCGEEKRLAEFSAYPYINKLGNPGTRYESRCRPCNAQRRMERYNANPEREQSSARKWKARNANHISDYNREKQKDPIYRANKAKSQRLRKARIRSGQGDGPEIRAIYEEAMRVEALIQLCPVFDIPELGKKIHVDHVIALANGGQHIASNLQLLAAGLNMRKGTK